MDNSIDARGLDCPKPVIKTKEAVDSGMREVSVNVDNEVAACNVMRFLQGRGFSVEREDKDGEITIKGSADGLIAEAIEADTRRQTAPPKGTLSFLITTDKIGANSDGLGDALMKSFLGALMQSDSPPATIALMNEAVKMALPENSTCDILADLEKKGVTLLICGTCTKQFGITERIKIGTISNMFEITEAVFTALKPVVIG